MSAATPLDDLLALIETLQEHIANHGGALRRSEALTRYALIDPLLRELGWDTSDPAKVVPEYAVSGGRADYALLVDGEPKVMVEAKNLGAPPDNAVTQGITYCMGEGTPYFALTDGEHWRLYETHRQVRAADKLIVRFSLRDGPVESALAALHFWRTRVEAEGVEASGSPHTIISETRSEAPEAPESSARRSQRRTEQDASPAPRGDAGGWQSLASYVHEAYAKPAEVRFTSGETERVKDWTDLNVKVVAWLVREGHLTQDSIPVQVGGRFIVAAGPHHPNGQEFKRRKRAATVFVEADYSGADILKNIHHVMRTAGRDPSEVSLRLRE